MVAQPGADHTCIRWIWRIRTMKQGYASHARLRGGGSILISAFEAKAGRGLPPPRIGHRQPQGLAKTTRGVERLLSGGVGVSSDGGPQHDAVRHLAGRRDLLGAAPRQSETLGLPMVLPAWRVPAGAPATPGQAQISIRARGWAWGGNHDGRQSRSRVAHPRLAPKRRDEFGQRRARLAKAGRCSTEGEPCLAISSLAPAPG